MQKKVETGGKTFHVAQMDIVDDTGGKIEMSVWDKAYDVVKQIPDGEGFTCIGCTATRDNKEVELNLWSSAHVHRGGVQAQSLTSLDESTLEVEVLTAKFVPTIAAIDVESTEAHPSCAAALAEAVGCSDEKVFQINRAFNDQPSRAEYLFAQDQRLYAQCRLRDKTGGVDIDVVSSAVPALFGCKDEAA